MHRIELLLIVMLFPGCFFGFDRSEPEPEPEPAPQFEEDRRAPSIVQIDVPDGGALGAGTDLRLRISDDRELGTLELQFVHYESRSFVSGETEQEVFVRAEELGEGYGTLGVRLSDAAGNSQQANVSRLLIDLTPPELDVLSSLIGHGQDLEILVQDAWRLGSVEVHIGDEVLRHDFIDARSSFGEAWDQSLVTFPSAALDIGEAEILVIARDSAGNETRQTATVMVDRLPPVVAIEPLPEGTLAGRFPVRVHVEDDQDELPTTTLLLSGTPVGQFAGRDGIVELDALDFAAGEHELSATSVDAAGNRGHALAVPIVLE